MWWMVTVPFERMKPEDYLVDGQLVETLQYMKGQAEIGGNTEYKHWQIVVCLKKKQRLSGIKKIFGRYAHLEPTRSAAALEYVWKDDTKVAGSEFEFGNMPMKRNVAKDWEGIWENAVKGELMNVPADIRVRCYSSLKRIEKDNMKPDACERQIYVLIGDTGVGKSHRAWNAAGLDAFPKDPNTKFWDGYQGQENVVIEEFRGKIDISHILRWFDKWPVCIENKGGGTVLKAKKIFITSNLSPVQWYPNLDEGTLAALMRRLKVYVVTNRNQEINFE